MVYLGGKSRIAKKIASIILARTTDRDVYLEPFVGGASVFVEMAPHFKRPIASDLHPDLIAMWQAVAKGWEPPHITEEEYKKLRERANEPSMPDALIGFAGFGCSFSGKWFGGYARDNYVCGKIQSDYVDRSRRSIAKFSKAIKGHKFFCVPFDYWTPAMNENTVVYADPPYEGTTGYACAAKAWPVLASWADSGAKVFVSEYKAPAGWNCIAEFPLRLRTEGGQGEIRTERLFTR